MLNFCPKCGEQVVKNAAFCVRCGIHLLNIESASLAPSSKDDGTRPPDKSIPSVVGAEKRNLLSLTRLFRRNNKAEASALEGAVEAVKRRPLFSPTFFYGMLGLFTIGILAAVIIPIAAGHALRGQDGGTAAIWFAICTYLVLRRRNKGKTSASGYAAFAFIVTLLTIGILNGLVNRDRYALNREFSKNPALVAIREFDPNTYEALVQQVLKITRDPANKGQIGKLVSSEASSIYRRNLRRTTDSSLINFYGAQIRTLVALRETDPGRCYQIGQGNYAPTLSNAGAPGDNRELMEAMAMVIRGAINQPDRMVEKRKADVSIDKAHVIAETRLGADAHLLKLVDSPMGNFRGACSGLIALMQAILELPLTESANILRSLTEQ